MSFWSTAGKIAGGLLGIAGTMGAQSLGGYLSYEQQRALNAEAFNREATYNHPASQMKRLKEAGLNPNLIYGSGSANTGNVKANVGTAPSYAFDPRVDENFLRYTNYEKATNDLKTQEASISKLRKETQLVDTQVKSMNQEMAIKQAQLKMQLQKLPYEIQSIMSGMSMNSAQINRLAKQSEYDYGMSPYLTLKRFIGKAYNEELKGTPLGAVLTGSYNALKSLNPFYPISKMNEANAKKWKNELDNRKRRQILKGRITN